MLSVEQLTLAQTSSVISRLFGRTRRPRSIITKTNSVLHGSLGAAASPCRWDDLFYRCLPHGLVVRIPAFHVGGPGSIPGVGTRVLPVWHSVVVPSSRRKRLSSIAFQSQNPVELARSRTWNLLIRSQTRYPLRHKPGDNRARFPSAFQDVPFRTIDGCSRLSNWL